MVGLQYLLGALVLILLACGGLALGQWLGRPPISGSCRPDAAGACAHKDNCSLRLLCRRESASMGDRRPTA